MINTVNFKGNLSNYTKVKKLTADEKYIKIPAAFIELDIKSKKDFDLLEKIATRWAFGDIYANDIYQRFKANVLDTPEIQNERFFILTTQMKNFNKLKANKVLGVAELYKPSRNKTEIEFLQANPKFLNPFKPREIVGVGKAMVSSCINIIKDKEIVLFATPKAKSLYEYFGFKNIESNLMILKR